MMAVASFTTCLLVLLILYVNKAFSSTGNIELEWQRIEQTTGHHLVNASAIRVTKFNRTLAVINGTATLFLDLGEPYEFRVSVAYSRIGNTQFVEYPMKIGKNKLCTTLNDSYRDYQYLWANCSNFPQVKEGEMVCPFPKGNYWLKNYAPDPSWVPPVVPEGFWRMTVDILTPDDEIELQFRTYAVLKKAII